MGDAGNTHSSAPESTKKVRPETRSLTDIVPGDEDIEWIAREDLVGVGNLPTALTSGWRSRFPGPGLGTVQYFLCPI